MCDDDLSVDDATLLYRRVHPNFIVPDNNRGCVALASGAFQNPEMSVVLGDTLEVEGREPGSLLDSQPEGVFLVAFPARTARAASQAVCRDPLSDETAHGLVAGKKNSARKRLMAAAAQWVVAPDGACEPPAAYP